MKKIKIILVTFLTCLCGCSSGQVASTPQSSTIATSEPVENYNTIELQDIGSFYESENNDSFKTATNIYTNYALKIFKDAYKDNEENSLISPYSLFAALSILSNGTNNDTKKLLETFLGMSVDDLNKFNSDIQSQMYDIGNANGLWFNLGTGLTLKDSFKETVGNYYGLDSLKESDFTNNISNVVSEVNDWAKTKSNETIDNIISESDINDRTSFLLLNALSSTAKWIDTFESNNTYTQEFHNLDGSIGNATMMHMEVDGYWHTDTCEGFVKDLNNGTAFVGILPNEDIDFDEFVSNLDTETIMNLIDGKISYDDEGKEVADFHITRLAFPKFKYDNEYSLSDHLKELGLSSLFTEADFTNMVDGDSEKVKLLIVDEVKQKTNVEVNEEEVKMSAVTVVQGQLGNAGPPVNYVYHDVTFDRPFMFMLIDNCYFSDSRLMLILDETEYAHFPLFIGSISYMNDEEVIEQNSSASDVIGQCYINVDAIKVRTAPNLSAEQVDVATVGQLKDVYEVVENDGYTWYRIGEDNWIASDGSWVSYTPYN